jgi:hypothetical protein
MRVEAIELHACGTSHFIMKLLLTILLLTIYSCSMRKSDKWTMKPCQEGEKEAIEDFKAGEIIFIRSGFLPRYDSVLEGLLASRGIKYSFDMFGHLYQDCYPNTMDSLVNARFGDGFVDNLELQADSLFFEAKRNAIFYYYEVDTWAMRKNSDYHLGGDFIIDYLNEKLTAKSSFRFVSNIVDRPNYFNRFYSD